jgi:hypothetical protein
MKAPTQKTSCSVTAMRALQCGFISENVANLRDFPIQFSDGSTRKICQTVYYSIAKQAGLSILMAGLLSACSVVIDLLLKSRIGT